MTCLVFSDRGFCLRWGGREGLGGREGRRGLGGGGALENGAKSESVSGV